jgi:hypothetical protein
MLESSERCARQVGCSRAEYFRRAIKMLNGQMEAAARARRMAEASRRVRKESMKVNAEFAAIERDPEE